MLFSVTILASLPSSGGSRISQTGGANPLNLDQKSIVTARKLRLWKGNVFIRVYHSVHRGGVYPGGCIPACNGAYPLGRHPPLEARHPLHSAVHAGIRSTSGLRYASQWNAFLFGKISAKKCMKMKQIGPRWGARPWRPLDSANAITLLIPNPELRLVIINFAKP